MDKISVTDLQKSYLIEFITELKRLADSFVLISGQALPYLIKNPRTTKDINFVLDVYALRKTDKEIDEIVYKLYGITDEEKKIIEGEIEKS
jgi:hypothetical protein